MYLGDCESDSTISFQILSVVIKDNNRNNENVVKSSGIIAELKFLAVTTN